MIKNKLFLCLLATMVAIFSVCIMQAGTVQTIRTAKSSVKTEPDGKKKKKTANKSDDGTTVTLITTGTGSTKEEATKNALRDALEQTYGTFVSANTLVINDKLIKDEIVSISSGNIVKYEVVSFIDSKPMIVTVEAVVSISNLITYAQNKGMEAELAGNTFAMNMKLEELNRKNQYIAVKNFVKQIELTPYNIFDFGINVNEPKRVGENSVDVNISIKTKANKNALLLYDLIHNTLKKLSMMVKYDYVHPHDFPQGHPTISWFGGWHELYKPAPPHVRRLHPIWFRPTSHLYTQKNQVITYILKEKYSNLMGDDYNLYWDIHKKLQYIIIESLTNFSIVDNIGHVYEFRYKEGMHISGIGTLIGHGGHKTTADYWVGCPREILLGLELFAIDLTLHYTMDEISKINKIEVRPKNPL